MILIVDDDEAGRYAIARKLTARGHLTAESVGGGDALRVLNTMAPPPRLVLLDWYMPPASGLETFQAIRSDPRFKHLPVVVFSALCSRETSDAVLAAGAQGFVVKEAPDFWAICDAAARYAPPARLK
jgi:CheY-like chemotaxis protein